jgi:hypothetical protein
MNVQEAVIQYATGKQDISKFKKLIGEDCGSFVSIDMGLPRKVLRHWRTNVIKKFRQSIKNYCMVSRLKK